MMSPCPLHELLGQQENLVIMDNQAALFWSPDNYMPLLAIIKWGNLLKRMSRKPTEIASEMELIFIPELEFIVEM